MWTGTAALKNIDQNLQTLRHEVVRLDSQVDQVTAKVASDQRYRAKLINQIASVRLSEIESGELDASFNRADQYVAQLLAQRDQAQIALGTEIDQVNQRIIHAETIRDALLETANHTSSKIVEVEGAVQQELANNQVYLSQLEKAKAAESVAEEAAQKVQRAQANMSEKAKPYQADELFMYLWGRAYGTTEYSAGLFTRFMDAWVARTIKYEPSRVNYWNLVEIPRRLDEHAKRVGDEADEQHMQLQQMELNSLDAAGAKRLEAELESLRAKLDEHDDVIESLEAELNANLQKRASFVAGEDRYIGECLNKISKSLEHQSLHVIHRYVSDTISPTDDRLVIELQALDDSIGDIEGELDDVRDLHQRRLSKLKELEKVRRDFKNSRFDDVRSGFSNKAIISGVLGQFLQGLVSGADVWRVIKRNQRYQKTSSIPDFGSGGLGEIADILGGEIMRQGRRQRRSSRGSTWHWPKPRGGSGGFKMPRRGGRGSGGGFKTGGGF